MIKLLFAFLALVFAAVPARAGGPRVMEFDVAVIGAGCGGSAAAIQAAMNSKTSAANSSGISH